MNLLSLETLVLWPSKFHKNNNTRGGDTTDTVKQCILNNLTWRLKVNVCCNIRNVKSNCLRCIASQCLLPPCVFLCAFFFHPSKKQKTTGNALRTHISGIGVRDTLTKASCTMCTPNHGISFNLELQFSSILYVISAK